jgi:hypothetical protein
VRGGWPLRPHRTMIAVQRCTRRRRRKTELRRMACPQGDRERIRTC